MDGESEHAVELAGEVSAPFKIGGREDLTVAGGFKVVSFLFEFLAELFPVVEFAVAESGDSAVGRSEGLLAVSEVEDGEALKAEVPTSLGVGMNFWEAVGATV